MNYSIIGIYPTKSFNYDKTCVKFKMKICTGKNESITDIAQQIIFICVSVFKIYIYSVKMVK